jgi:hypothetical protein
VRHAQLKGRDVKHLAGLRNLQRLTLGDNEFSDADLMPLQELRQLRELDLRGTALSPESARALQSALPETKLSHR